MEGGVSAEAPTTLAVDDEVLLLPEPPRVVTIATALSEAEARTLGIDRLVAILAGEENIREVIAFPKTQSGLDPMTNAPTPVADKQLSDLGIRVLPRVD